jgi:excisionase family DNA binding protein
MDATTKPDRLALSVREALKLVPLGRTAFYDAVRKGQIPSVRVGGRLLIPAAALRRMFESAPAQEPPRPAA